MSDREEGARLTECNSLQAERRRGSQFDLSAHELDVRMHSIAKRLTMSKPSLVAGSHISDFTLRLRRDKSLALH